MVRTSTPTVNGYNVAAPLMAAWIDLFVPYMRDRHGITLIIIKLTEPPRDRLDGISGPTHADGYAVDIRSWNLTASQRDITIREAGRLGLILHYRTRAQGFDPHLHGMLNVGYWTRCYYQIRATADGYDGLVKRGPDTHRHLRPPTPYPLAQAGIRNMTTALDTRTNLERLIDSMDETQLTALVQRATAGIPAAVLNTRIPVTRSGQRTTRTLRTLIESADTDHAAIVTRLDALARRLDALEGTTPTEAQ